MTENAEKTVEKLQIFKGMAQSNEVQQLAKIMIDYIEGDENKNKMGFKPGDPQ